MEMSRRSFIQSAIAAGAMPYLGCVSSRFPNGKVRLACVGIGQQAWYDIQEFEKTGLAEFVAFCDTDPQGKQCRPARKKFPNVPTFTDFRKMLDVMEGKVDAVAVMNPDFSHFPALMDAMRRGLAVFSEKPLAHTFEECELLMTAERKHGVVTQMGNQGHSGDNYWQFKHYVENGTLDVSKLTRLVAHMNMSRRWHKWNGKVDGFRIGEAIPKGLDWDTWLGTASYHEYSQDYVQGEWRSWYDFGNGALGDWGAHTMDTMHRFFDLGLPTRIDIENVTGWNAYVFPMQDTLKFRFPAKGKRPDVTLEWYEGIANTPELPKGFEYYKHRAAAVPPPGGVAAPGKQELLPGKFFCLSDGTAWQGGSHGSSIFRCGMPMEKVPEYPRPTSNHWANFLLSVMGKEEPRSPFSVAGPLCEVFCLGVIAQRLNRGFSFDPASRRVVGDAEADGLLKGSKGTPRAGWEEFYMV